MRALVIILATIILLLALAIGGCAVAFLADSVVAGVEGPGADIAIMATGFLLVAAALLALAIWLVRHPETRREGKDAGRVDSEAAGP